MAVIEKLEGCQEEHDSKRNLMELEAVLKDLFGGAAKRKMEVQGDEDVDAAPKRRHTLLDEVTKAAEIVAPAASAQPDDDV